MLRVSNETFNEQSYRKIEGRYYMENVAEKSKETKVNPIYVITVLEKDGSDSVKSDDGKDLGFPDLGSMATVGFYYSYEEAVEAMHSNACDIRECCYSYGLVKKIYPGLYTVAMTDDWTFFAWDSEKEGFFEKDAPESLSHSCFMI